MGCDLWVVPALFTMMSSRPKVSTASLTMAATSSFLVTSVIDTTAFPPAATISCCDPLGSLPADIRDDNMSAFLCEELCDAFTESAACARYDCDLPVQFHTALLRNVLQDMSKQRYLTSR